MKRKIYDSLQNKSTVDVKEEYYKKIDDALLTIKK